MRLHKNILFQYTVSTFTVILIISSVLGFLLTRFTFDLQIKKHIELYPEIIRQAVIDHPTVTQFLLTKNYTAAQEDNAGFIKDLMSFGTIFRVKIWGENSAILWSDDKEIIGKKFPDNEEYKTAWSGKMEYDVSKPEKDEQFSETNHKQIMEIYSPVKENGKVIGVIELYEAIDTLYDEIQSNSIFIWGIVLAAGILLYFLQFYLFYRAYKIQKETNNRLSLTQDVTILSLSSIVETRDNETGAHILRTQRYIKILAEYLKANPRFKKFLNNETIDLLFKSSPLHDIGKVGIPDAILQKPGKLTSEEFETMKKHTVYGWKALIVAEEKLGSNSFLELAREIALAHHEKWDGSGYPRGLKGDEISFSGRLMALADVYDALTSKRVYKEAFTHENAKAIILKGRGSHFDPDIVDAFLNTENKFIEVAKAFTDEGEAGF